MNPFTFLIHVILCALAVLAAWNTFRPGQIFSRIGAFVRRKAPTEKSKKPTVDCPVCMPSIYGTVYFWCFMAAAFKDWPTLLMFWALLIFCASGLNKVLVSLKFVDLKS